MPEDNQTDNAVEQPIQPAEQPIQPVEQPIQAVEEQAEPAAPEEVPALEPVCRSQEHPYDSLTSEAAAAVNVLFNQTGLPESERRNFSNNVAALVFEAIESVEPSEEASA